MLRDDNVHIAEIRELVRRAEAGEKIPGLVGPEAELADAIEELNAKHFVTRIDGQTVVVSLEHDQVLDRDRLVYMRSSDLVIFYKNRKIVTGYRADGKTAILKDLGTAWIEHPQRRTYERIELIPVGECPDNVYNLWRGFGVDPKPGDWPLIRKHLLEVVCGNNPQHFDWLVRWCAYCVQHPDRRAEVAVVLKGEKGTGKGTLGQILLRIFGSHGLQVNNPQHFTGRFNAHLQHAILLFVDEAFWAGDKASEGVLKALVTEPAITIEPKHVNMFSVPSRLKILIASNSDWVVPATADERRFFALNVSSCHIGDREYFNALWGAIKGEELAGFLNDLLALDLSGFDHRDPPHTDALNEQKLRSSDSFDSFWFDCLTEGAIVGERQRVGGPGVALYRDASQEEEGWPSEVGPRRLYDAYVDHAHARGERYPASLTHMGKKLVEVLPAGYPRVIRRHRGPRRYILPPLEDCRASFLRAKRIETYAWPAVEEGPPEEGAEDF